VVVRDGVIAAVGANVSVPSDARSVDGAGLTVYPGFIEAGGSLGIPAPRAGGDGARAEAPNSAMPPGQQPELTALDLLSPTEGGFTAAQGAGFTSALTAPTGGIFVGQSAVVSLRDGATQEIVVRSPVAMHVGFETSRAFGGGYPNSLLGVFAVLRQTLLDARHYGAEQAAYEANPRGRARPANNPSLAALQPVLTGSMPVVMTANTEREIERALDLAKEFGFRPIISGGREAHKLGERLKAENVPVLLSLDFPTRPANRSPDAAPEPMRVLRERVEAPHTPALLTDMGVRVAFQSGGDYKAFLANVQRAVASGLSREQALRALTTTPAELFGLSDSYGAIEVGRQANLTLVNSDVFSAGAKVASVFVDGRHVQVAPQAGAPSRAGGARSLAGSWTATVTIEGTDYPVTLGLQQGADGLRGTLQGSLGTGQISNSSLDGAGGFSFTATITLPGGTEEGTFTGTMDGNSIRGTVTILGHEPGTFVGTRPSGGSQSTTGASTTSRGGRA